MRGEKMSVAPGGISAEGFCGIIIDTLKELRSNPNPITACLLHRTLSKRREYRQLIESGGIVDLFPHGTCTECGPQDAESLSGLHELPAEPEENPPNELYTKELKDFDLNLLSEFEDRFPEDCLARVSELRDRIAESREIGQILKYNDGILEIIRATELRINRELNQFNSFIDEIGRNLVGIESELISSFLHANEVLTDSLEFNIKMERRIDEISMSIHNSMDITDIKNNIISKLSMIKNSLEQKRKDDEIQLKDVANEIDKLKSHIKDMQQEIGVIQNKALVLEQETLSDPLTRIFNRRAYDKRIQEELARYFRYRHGFALVVIDIDHFKAINDKFGHWAGDRCLVELAKLLKTGLRETDFVARYGGEEFVAILQETDEDGIASICERLKYLIERSHFVCGDTRIPLTVSMGGTRVRISDLSADTVFQRADNAMYEAKKRGRNCVVVA
jgi:diguanylate cyclase